MVLDYEKFMLKQTEWRGVVTTKLDNINSEVSEIKDNIKQINNKMDQLNRRLNQTNIRVAGIAGTISIIVAIITASVINGLG